MRRPGLHPILVGFGDKAFLAALILIRLADYRHVAAQRCSLMHLPVIEERIGRWPTPHRPSLERMADPTGQAVETF